MSEAAVAPAARRPGWRIALVWIAVWLVAALALARVAGGVDWPKVRDVIAAADAGWTLAACVAGLAGIPLWLLAWRALIPDPPPTSRLLEVQTVAYASIQTLSMLGGGAVAIFMLVRRGGLSYGGAVSLLALDQVLTGLVKVSIVGAALAFSPAPAALRTAGGVFLVAVCALCAAVLAISYSSGFVAGASARPGGLWARCLAIASEAAGALRAARSPGRFGFAFVCYLARRSVEGVAALCVMKACGAPVSVEAALLTVAVVSLTTVAPGPPGNIGVYEAAVSFAYAQTGLPAEQALALAVLQHIAFLFAALLPGYVMLAARRPWRTPPAALS